MCGIFGLAPLNTTNNKLLKSLPKLLDALKHRGPDDEGCTFFSKNNILSTYGNDTPENVKNSNLAYTPTSNISELTTSYFLGLGHRRLSIIDLSEYGHQPMCDPTENYWIVYNGEIYNYQELKLELEQLGYKFITQTDTEVLLNAYIEWGADCLDKLNGMWSFVIFDRNKNELFGARDRFGVKPFYYINDDNYFAFSSEIKALINIPDFEKKLNPQAVYEYLVGGKLELSAESFFKGIYELKPAHYFNYNLSSKSLETKKYFELSYNNEWEKFDKKKAQEITEEIYKKVYKAVKIRLNAEVKVGNCLSGGLDSSIVSCIINDVIKNNEQQELFTAVYPNTIINEEYWAEIVVKTLNSKWNKTYPNSQDLKTQLEDLIYYQDIPFTSSSSFSQYKVMELAKKNNVKVTLDGQGADELFGGYSPHYVSSVYNSLKTFSFSSFFNNITGVSSNFSKRSLLYFLPLKYFFAKSFKKSYQKKLIKTQPELAYINKQFWKNNSENSYNTNFNTNLNELLANEFTEHTLKHLLRLVDRNSMRFSIESRTPFVDDKELVEYVFNQSATYKIRNGSSKYLLREAFKRLIPKKIYERTDKIGFATPEKEWMQELKPYIKEVVGNLKNDEYVSWEDLHANFENIFNSALKSNTQRLWRLINFAIWKKVYKV